MASLSRLNNPYRHGKWSFVFAIWIYCYQICCNDCTYHVYSTVLLSNFRDFQNEIFIPLLCRTCHSFTSVHTFQLQFQRQEQANWNEKHGWVKSLVINLSRDNNVMWTLAQSRKGCLYCVSNPVQGKKTTNRSYELNAEPVNSNQDWNATCKKEWKCCYRMKVLS